MTNIRKKSRAIIAQEDCVACGCCMRVCVLNAVEIVKGLFAKVDENKCVGCGLCVKECPASIIEIKEVEK